jgi:hypothetical protein
MMLEAVKRTFDAAREVKADELANTIRCLYAFDAASDVAHLVRRFPLLTTVVPALCSLACRGDPGIQPGGAAAAVGGKRKSPDAGESLSNAAVAWLQAALSPSSIKNARAGVTVDAVATSFRAVSQIGNSEALQVSLVNAILALDVSIDQLLLPLVRRLHALIPMIESSRNAAASGAAGVSAAANPAFKVLAMHVMTSLRSATAAFKKPAPMAAASASLTWRMVVQPQHFCAAKCSQCRCVIVFRVEG